MRNKKYLIITAGIIMVLLFSAFSKAGGGPVTDIPRTIYNGTGKVTIVPDIDTINVGVHTENEDVSAALAENNAKAMSVRDALVKFGVKAKDIQTTSFTIYPNQQYGPMGEMLGVKCSG